jgi:hypothetical protein
MLPHPLRPHSPAPTPIPLIRIDPLALRLLDQMKVIISKRITSRKISREVILSQACRYIPFAWMTSYTAGGKK